MDVFYDVRRGARILSRNPGFTSVAVLILALGIGANSAIFSVVNGVLLQPLPYNHPERLAMIRISIEGQEFLPSFSPPEIMDFRGQTQLFEGVAAIRDNTAAVTGKGEPEQIEVGMVTSNFLSLLGVKPILGRNFVAEDDVPNRSPVVIISHDLWQRRFGGSPEILGRTIQLNGRGVEVVGVLPAGLRLLLAREAGLPSELDAWHPFGFDFRSQQRDFRWVRAIARLKPGVGFERAAKELNVLAGDLLRTYPEYGGLAFRVHVEPLQGDLVRTVRPALLALLGAVAFVLLIASANAANLLLVHAARREKEIAIRASMGASRRRIIRQVLTESALLAFLGGAAGLLLAQWAIELLRLLAPSNLPRLENVGIDRSVLLFTLGISVLVVFLVGLIPALNASETSLSESLKEGGRSSRGSSKQRVRSFLVVSEIALCTVLLAGAGLMIRSFIRLQKADPGFRLDTASSFYLSLPFARYPAAEKINLFFEKLSARAASLPGVKGIGGVFPLPMSGRFWTAEYAFDDETEQEWGAVSADQHAVTPGYFEALGARLHAGRFFKWADVAKNRNYVVVDDRLARIAWPGENPIGKKLKAALPNNQRRWLEVIGVVQHIRQEHPNVEGREQIYLPINLWPFNTLPMVIRASGDPAAVMKSIEREVHALDKDLPVYRIRTMKDYFAEATLNNRFTTVLMGIFAGLALVLATVGLYSVVAYSVSQRNHEIGIRMALGAGRMAIFRLVIGNGLLLTLTGIGIGAAGAIFLTRLLASLLYGVTATDLQTFAGITLLLSLVSLTACCMPARRATRVDPVLALRSL